MLKNYVCTKYFIIDLAAGIPYEILSDKQYTITVLLLPMLKFLKIFKSIQILEHNRFSFIFSNETMRQFIKLMYLIFSTVLIV